MLVAHGAFLSNHFSAKKTDQFQIDGPVTLISKWRSATARKKDAAWPDVVGEFTRRQVAGFIFEGTEVRTVIGVVTMLWSFYIAGIERLSETFAFNQRVRSSRVYIVYRVYLRNSRCWINPIHTGDRFQKCEIFEFSKFDNCKLLETYKIN